MAQRIAVVISQGQSQNPAKRGLEEDLVAALLLEGGVEVTVVPHLYDLRPEGTGVLALKNLGGDVVLLSWLFPRAAHWVLERHGIRGKVGETELHSSLEEDEDDLDAEADEEKARVADQLPPPNRTIFCLDLRSSDRVEPFLEEIRRIRALPRAAAPAAPRAGLVPLDFNVFGGNGNGDTAGNGAAGNGAAGNGAELPSPVNELLVGGPLQPVRIEEEGPRRWYPVIDYSRCTNCMECIDFCLFGVYGVDGVETILVEQPDNCRKGCPACSRVCPENAIMFPQHKTPAIAGAEVAASGLKIDLSLLFGAPEVGKSAEQIAAEERDEQLRLAGRAPAAEQALPAAPTTASAGASANASAGGTTETATDAKDELDSLLDQLDQLDL